MSADLPERRIELARSKLVWTLLMSLGFVALGLWFLTLDATDLSKGSRPVSPALMHGIAWLSVITFGFFGGLIAMKAFDRRTGLTLKADGFVDYSSAIGPGFVPWHDVTGFAVQQVQAQRNLVILVSDPQKYVHAANWMKAWAYRANIKLVGSPLAISPGSLKIDFDELAQTMHRYWQRASRGAAIAIAGQQ